MNLQVALKNYKFINTLDLDTVSRFYATEDGALWIDDRWFQSVRRTYTGESRQDLLGPIDQTWHVLIDKIQENPSDDSITLDDLSRTLDILETYIKRLYGIYEYNGIFNATFRRIRLAIVEAKRETQNKVVMTSQPVMVDNDQDQLQDVSIDSSSQESVKSICPPIPPMPVDIYTKPRVAKKKTPTHSHPKGKAQRRSRKRKRKEN